MSDLDDLDALAEALDELATGTARHARFDVPAAGSGTESKLDSWLRVLSDRRGSDLLLVAGEPPTIRINGVLHRSESAPLDGVEIEELVRTLDPGLWTLDYFDNAPTIAA